MNNNAKLKELCKKAVVAFWSFLFFILLFFLAVAPSISHASAFKCGTWQWPVKKISFIRKFEKPPAKWLAGHRGVDFAAHEGLEVFAPNDGTITFKSLVAQKPVVVISHGNLKSTFEPVVSNLPLNSSVKKGDKIGIVSFSRDISKSHCTEKGCVHWGIKKGKDDYLDPEKKINCCPIVLLE